MPLFKFTPSNLTYRRYKLPAEDFGPPGPSYLGDVYFYRDSLSKTGPAGTQTTAVPAVLAYSDGKFTIAGNSQNISGGPGAITTTQTVDGRADANNVLQFERPSSGYRTYWVFWDYREGFLRSTFITNTASLRPFNNPVATVLVGVTGTDMLVTPMVGRGATITTDNLVAGSVTTNILAAGSVTASRIAAGTITANEIAANTITGGRIAANTITGTNIQAGTITSDLLNATEIKVGGGGSKPGKFGVYNATDVQIGFIGVESGNEGAWFKTISIGGTNYATGKLKADSSGNVSLTDGSISITGNSTTVTVNTTVGFKVTASGFTLQGNSTNLAADDGSSNKTLLLPVGVRCQNLSGTTIAEIANSGGSGVVTVFNSSGNSKGTLSLVSGGGDLTLRDSAGSIEAALSTAVGYGQLSLQDGGTEKIFLDANFSGNPQIRVGGNRVITNRGSAVTQVSGTAGSTYTSTEQTLINDLVTAVNAIRDRLRVTGGHGLIAD